jgi:hypothetical protein
MQALLLCKGYTIAANDANAVSAVRCLLLSFVSFSFLPFFTAGMYTGQRVSALVVFRDCMSMNTNACEILLVQVRTPGCAWPCPRPRARHAPRTPTHTPACCNINTSVPTCWSVTRDIIPPWIHITPSFLPSVLPSFLPSFQQMHCVKAITSGLTMCVSVIMHHCYQLACWQLS